MNKRVLLYILPLLAAVTTASANTTYVSGSGNDANSCSEISPCRTFAGAMPKTTIAGVIMALDSADFGLGNTLSMAYPVTIDGGAHGAYFTGPNAATAIDVFATSTKYPNTIRLAIFAGVAGGSGITAMTQFGTLNIESVTVTLRDANTGYGISVQGDAASLLNFDRVSVTGGTTGISLVPTINGQQPAFPVSFQQVSVTGSSVAAQLQNVNITIRDSTFRSNFWGLLFTYSNGAPTTNALIEHTQFVNNSTAMFVGPPHTVRLSNSIFSGNTTAAINSTGTVISFRNNVFAANGVDGLSALSTSLK